MMASFNPFQMMGGMNGIGNGINPMKMMQQMFGGKNYQQNTPPVNHQQMKQLMPNINKNMLAQLVEQARQKGISEDDIEKGLDFLLKLNN